MASKSSGMRLKVKIDPKIIIALLIALALSAAAYLLFTSPMGKQAADAKTQVTVMQHRLNANEEHIQAVKSGKDVPAAQLLTQASSLDTLLPATVDDGVLAGTFSQLALARGVTVTQLNPVSSTDPNQGATTAAQSAGGTKFDTFSVAATGSVQGLTQWMSDLMAYQSLVTLNNVGFTSSGGQDTVSFTLYAHYIPTPPVAAAKK